VRTLTSPDSTNATGTVSRTMTSAVVTTVPTSTPTPGATDQREPTDEPPANPADQTLGDESSHDASEGSSGKQHGVAGRAETEHLRHEQHEDGHLGEVDEIDHATGNGQREFSPYVTCRSYATSGFAGCLTEMSSRSVSNSWHLLGIACN
jgi:hypothetical protein